MADLLLHGDSHGVYASRSEAVMATAVAAASAGWTFTQWRQELDAGEHELAQWSTHARRKHGGTRPRSAPDTERRLATTWRRAQARARLRPAAADAASVRGELAAIRNAVDTSPQAWAGSRGVTDHAVMQSVLTIAWSACRLTVSASSRQIAEAANISYGTASIALRRLAVAGWLRLETPADGPKPGVYRLLIPADAGIAVRRSGQDLDELLETLPPRELSFNGSSRSHDVFAHTIHRGLGRVAARVFDALDDGAYGGLDVDQVSAVTGLHPQTVRKHLIALQAAGLANTGGRGRSWARSLAAGDPLALPCALEDAALVLGCLGVAHRRQQRHEEQREAYVTWWVDFQARRGWAVQRGLYRPDQQQLPAAQAA